MEPPFTEATPEAGAKAGEEIYRHYAGRMDKKGLTDDYLIKKLKAELNAKATKVFLPKNSRKPVYSDPLITDMVKKIFFMTFAFLFSMSLAKAFEEVSFKGTDKTPSGDQLISFIKLPVSLSASAPRGCTRDEGRSLGAGLQEQASNHLKLRW